MATMTTISLKSLDVGFSLRETKTPIDVPACIGYPGHYFAVETDEGRIEGRPCDIGSKLRKLGYTVSPRWFAGRENWGRALEITTGAEDRATFAAVEMMSAAEKQLKARGIIAQDATPAPAELAEMVRRHGITL